MFKIFEILKKPLSVFSRSESGNVTIEAAVAFSLISLLLIGGADFSRLVMKQSQLEHIARAGTQYGLRGQTDALDLTAVVAAARNSIGVMDDSIVITAENVCRCPTTGNIGCYDTCADDSYPQMFLTVLVTTRVNYLFGYNGAPIQNLQASTVLRVR